VVANDQPNDNTWITTEERGRKSEYWNIVPVTSGPFAGKSAYQIRSVFDKVLSPEGGQIENKVSIQQTKFNGGIDQIWIIREI